MALLIKLSENEKRVIIALLIVFILIFVLIGLLGSLVVKTMKYQGKKMDNLVSDVVTTRVITTKKKFFPYARKKNRLQFFKQSYFPIILLTIGLAILLIFEATHGFKYNPFNTDDGFGTLFYTFNLSNKEAYTTKIFGLTVISSWPPIATEPHFVWKAWAAYLSLPIILVGGLWYLVTAQCYLARTIRMYKLASTIFDKSLEGFNQNTPMNTNPMQKVDSEQAK